MKFLATPLLINVLYYCRV